MKRFWGHVASKGYSIHLLNPKATTTSVRVGYVQMHLCDFVQVWITCCKQMVLGIMHVEGRCVKLKSFAGINQYISISRPCVVTMVHMEKKPHQSFLHILKTVFVGERTMNFIQHSVVNWHKSHWDFTFWINKECNCRRCDFNLHSQLSRLFC